MNTYTVEANNITSHKVEPIPETPRGRALLTVDWFLNGTPVLGNHDDPKRQLSAVIKD